MTYSLRAKIDAAHAKAVADEILASLHAPPTPAQKEAIRSIAMLITRRDQWARSGRYVKKEMERLNCAIVNGLRSLGSTAGMSIRPDNRTRGERSRERLLAFIERERAQNPTQSTADAVSEPTPAEPPRTPDTLP